LIAPRQRVSFRPASGQPEGRAAFFYGSLMTPFEIVEIDEMITACNGGGGAMGHPRVYLNLAPSGRVECPYCSRLFVNPAVAVHDAPPHPEAPPASGG
jgi:uncharacterized Zn-finger protein